MIFLSENPAARFIFLKKRSEHVRQKARKLLGYIIHILLIAFRKILPPQMLSHGIFTGEQGKKKMDMGKQRRHVLSSSPKHLLKNPPRIFMKHLALLNFTWNSISKKLISKKNEILQ